MSEVKRYTAGALYEEPRTGGTSVVLAADYDALREKLARYERIGETGRSLGDELDRIAELTEKLTLAREENKRLRERLEIAYAWDGNGNKVPFPEGAPDGIACRDETIRGLEAQLSKARQELAEAYERAANLVIDSPSYFTRKDRLGLAHAIRALSPSPEPEGKKT